MYTALYFRMGRGSDGGAPVITLSGEWIEFVLRRMYICRRHAYYEGILFVLSLSRMIDTVEGVPYPFDFHLEFVNDSNELILKTRELFSYRGHLIFEINWAKEMAIKEANMLMTEAIRGDSDNQRTIYKEGL